MAESYRPSQSKFWYGNSSDLLDLTSHIEAFAINGGTIIDRRQRITGTGELGTTADVISCGLQVQATIREHSSITDLFDNPEADLFVHRADAARVVAFDAGVTARPISAPADGAVTLAATFMQLAKGNAVEGAALTSGSLPALPDPNPTDISIFRIDSSDDSILNTAGTLASGDVGVRNAAWRANNTPVGNALTINDLGTNLAVDTNDVVLGKNAGLAIRHADGASGVTILTGKVFGTDSLAFNVATANTVVPGGRGIIGVQRSKFSTYDFSFSTDANAITDPVLRAANGTKLHCGLFDGVRAWGFKACLTVSLIFNIPADRCMYNIAIAIDGKPTDLALA